jgi:hypothetical protein
MFSIQLNESTDVTSLAQLLVYVRYVYNDDIKTEFLLCKPLETTTTARDIFKVVSDFLKNTVSSAKTDMHFVQTEPLPCWVADPDFKL